MQKLFYIFSFVLVVAIFSSILPYPVFSNYTNVTESDVYQINNYFESEISATQNSEIKILKLKQDDAAALLDGEFEIFDMQSRTSFMAIRTGGQNHADIEPLESKVYKLFPTTWQRRPVLVKINENTYIPASLATYPHGFSTTGQVGHYCLHFKNSKTEGTKKIDSKHQQCVKFAAKNGEKFIKNNLS